MLNKNLKLAIYGGLIVAAAFSCAKKEEVTVKDVPTAEAGSTLTNSDASYKSDLTNYKEVTTVTTQSLSALGNLGAIEGGVSLSSNIQNVARMESTDETNDLLNHLSHELGAISLVSKSSDPNARQIPSKFADAKGIWVVTFTGKFFKSREWCTPSRPYFSIR